MKPAGLKQIFAFFFVFTVAAQTALAFSMPKAVMSVQRIDSLSSEQRFYDVAYDSSASFRVALASGREKLYSTGYGSFNNAEIFVGNFARLYPELKVTALDFSRVEISVIDQMFSGVALKVLSASLLGYYGVTEKKSSAASAPGILIAPVAADRAKEKARGPVNEQVADINLSSSGYIDVAPQSTLILRC